jgi:hypothetical protein
MPLIVEEAARALSERPLVMVRPVSLAERVVFVGGLPGCGKTMITPILGSFARVEIQKFNYMLEHLCDLCFLGKIQDDVATTVIRMLVDIDVYNVAMARETNFRFSDLSSAFKNPGTWRYIRRLFLPGDAAAVERIRHEHPILQLTIHNVLAISWPLFKALGERMRIVEIVRHPLYMVEQWYRYMDRYGTDVRDFAVCFDYHGQALPFFAYGWEERYVRSSSMDRVIYAIERLAQSGAQVFGDLSERQQAQVMAIPFERFVLDPWPYLKQLERLLGTTVTSVTQRELRRQRVPRKMVAEGVSLPIYKQYGWKPPEGGADERRELDRRRQFAADHATAEAMAVLDRLSNEYESLHFHPPLVR